MMLHFLSFLGRRDRDRKVGLKTYLLFRLPEKGQNDVLLFTKNCVLTSRPMEDFGWGAILPIHLAYLQPPGLFCF